MMSPSRARRKESHDAVLDENILRPEIRASPLRRFLILLALKTTARFFRRDGHCAPISRHLIVKTGEFVFLPEAVAMDYVASHTSVPVPRVHCAFVHKGRAYIVMERIRGAKSIAAAVGAIPDDDRARLLAQLRPMFQELRALARPPGMGVCSAAGGPLRDYRFPRARYGYGPFGTVHEFHDWLREGLHIGQLDLNRDPDFKDIDDMIARQNWPFPPPVFTHGDLNPFNILVRHGQVVSIIDWEFAGWYPSYWEYTSAWFGNRSRQAWQAMIAEFLDTYPEELKMELTRQRWFGEV